MIAFISDVHGNYAALKAVLADIDSRCIHDVLSLGDVSGYGPCINECCDELRARGIPNLMGNQDRLLMTGESCGRSSSVDFAIAYQRSVVTKNNYEWVCESSESLRTNLFFACHGGPDDFVDQYLREPPYAFDEQSGLFVSGHTHIQVLYEEGKLKYLNPGSVGQPRDHDPRAAYAVLHDNGKVELVRVEYDIEKTAEDYRMAGFQDKFYTCLFGGKRIGEK